MESTCDSSTTPSPTIIATLSIISTAEIGTESEKVIKNSEAKFFIRNLFLKVLQEPLNPFRGTH